MKKLCLIPLLLTLFAISTNSEAARYALIIGNSNYQYLKPLKNPKNDARRIAERFKELGYELIGQDALYNLNAEQLLDALTVLRKKLKKDDIVFMYYAGHGVEQRGRGAFLLPVDTKRLDLLPEGLLLDNMIQSLTERAQLTVAVFDACRNITELQPLFRGEGGELRSMAQGQINTGKGQSIIAFSAKSDHYAKDGAGAYSPYNEALNTYLSEPWEIGDLFRKVAAEVGKHSGQRPEVLTDAPPDTYYFIKPIKSAVTDSLQAVARVHPDVISLIPAQAITDSTLGMNMDMIWIPPTGEQGFKMGSPSNEAGRDDDETEHTVILSQGFYLGKYEVTQGQWEKVMGSNPSDNTHIFSNTDNYPVEKVSWNDVLRFIQKLNSQTDNRYGYRLPTEAEWEYAARAGTRTPFSFGDIITPQQANYDGNYPYNGGAKGIYRKTTVPFGSLPANAWGFHEMHGNVWEWVQDGYGDYPSNTVTDPQGASSGSSRVNRGGSWLNVARYLRAAGRSYGSPGSQFNSLGFRLARTR